VPAAAFALGDESDTQIFELSGELGEADPELVSPLVV
jgi:hypothetical protein